MRKKLSIIVSIYNVEKYLEKCLKSLQQIKNIDVEVLLVNDGSTDNSLNICRDLTTLDSRFKLVTKVNGGLSDARNHGLKNSSGEFVFFLDGDDYINSIKLEEAYKITLKKKANVFIFGYVVDYESKSGSLEKQVSILPKAKMIDGTSENEFEEQDLNLIGYAWNKIYKKEYLLENNFYFEKGLSLIEDIVFNSMVLTTTENVVFINKSFVHYVQRYRETLGTKYYKNIIDLKLRAYDSYMIILKKWNVKHSSIYMNKLEIDYTKFLIKAIVKENNMNKSEKNKELKNLRTNLLKKFNYHYLNKAKAKDRIIISSFFKKIFFVNNFIYSNWRK